MKQGFSDSQIIGFLKEGDAGFPIKKLCWYGFSHSTDYKWKAQYGGMDVSEAQRLKALKSENNKLKRLLADALLGNAALKDGVSRKW